MHDKKEKILNLLTKELGEKKVFFDRDILDVYSVDETSDLKSIPDLLVRAENTQDVSTTLEICNELEIPVVPRGGGSGVTGGAIAVQGGVVLSMEKMNKIIEIDKENMVAVVEPGAITGDIQKAALDEGLMYPPDPASLDICSIGGNVAEIAGGPKAVKYGTTKDYVLGLEFVLPDGSVINSGGKFVKNATGYNLIGIILGSEGTLAVVTKIILKLIPAPVHSIDLLLPFDSIEAAVGSVLNILSNRLIPSTIEFMEDGALELVAKHLDNNIPFPDAQAHLLIQFDGNTREEIDSYLEKFSEIIDIDQDKILVADSPVQRERIWKARRSIRDCIHEESPVFLAEDCVVPRASIPDFLVKLKKYFKSKNLKSVIFGHAGDGNVHIDVLKGEMDYNDWMELVPSLKKEIYKRALGCGGTISGEHGIGFTRKNYISMAIDEAEVELSKRIKKAFDPKMILNPGKVFPD